MSKEECNTCGSDSREVDFNYFTGEMECARCFFNSVYIPKDMKLVGKCSVCGDKGNEVQLEYSNDKLLCEACYEKGVDDE